MGVNATDGEILDGWSGQEADTHSLEVLERVEDGCLEAMAESIRIRNEWLSLERSCREWCVLIISSSRHHGVSVLVI